MTLGLAYWILMLLWFVFNLYFFWGHNNIVGSNVLLFMLFLLIGWKVFGAPLHG